MESHGRCTSGLYSPISPNLIIQPGDATPRTVVVLLSSVRQARHALMILNAKTAHILSHLDKSIQMCSDLESALCVPGGISLTASILAGMGDTNLSANLLLALHAKTEISHFLKVVTMLDELLHVLATEIENAPREMQLSREAMTDLRSIAEAYAVVFAMAELCCAWAEISFNLAESHKLLLRNPAAETVMKVIPCDECDLVSSDRCIVSVRIMEAWSLSTSTSMMLNRFPSLRAAVHAGHSVRRAASSIVGSSSWTAVAGKLVAAGCVVAVAAAAAAYASKALFGPSLNSAAKAVYDADELAAYKELMLRQWDSAATDLMSRSLPRPAALQTGDMVVALPRETLVAETLRVQRMAFDARRSLSSIRSKSVAFGTAAGVVSAAFEKVVAGKCAEFSEQTVLSLRTSFAEQLESLASGIRNTMQSDSTADASCTPSIPPALAARASPRTLVGALFKLFSSPRTVETSIGDLEQLNRHLTCLHESLADVAGFWRHALAASCSVDGFRDASGGHCTVTTTDPADSHLLARLEHMLTSQGFGVDKPVSTFRKAGVAAERQREDLEVLELLQPAPHVRWHRVHFADQHRPNELRPWFIWETACQSCTEPFSPATNLTGDGSGIGGSDLLSVALCHRRHVMCATCGVRWLRAGRNRTRHYVPELQRRSDSAFHEVFALVAAWLKGHDTAVLSDASAPCPCCRRIISTRPVALASPFVRIVPQIDNAELQRDLKHVRN
jgi:hypothetical protein